MDLSMGLPTETLKGMDMGTGLAKNCIPISISIPVGNFKNPWENPWQLTWNKVFCHWQPWMAINVDYLWYLHHLYAFDDSYYLNKTLWITRCTPKGCRDTKPKGLYPWIWGWIQIHIHTHTRGKVSGPISIWIWIWRVWVWVSQIYPYPYPYSSLLLLKLL